LFTSGSSIDWTIARKLFIEAFKRNDCYDLVEYDPVQLNPDANGVIHLPPETTFDVPEPLNDTNEVVAAQILQVTDTYNTFLLDIENAAGLNDDIRANLRIKALETRRIEEMKVLNSRRQLEIAVENRSSDWRREKRSFEEKRAKCFRVFHESLGDAPRSICIGQLNANELRAAWIALNRYYHIAHGGRANGKRVNEILHNFTYYKDPQIYFVGNLANDMYEPELINIRCCLMRR